MDRCSPVRPTFVLALLLLSLGVDLRAQSSPPDLLTTQGRLTNASGVPENGARDMVFRFYDASGGGNQILVDSHTAGGGNAVTVTNGIYETQLGGGTVADGTGPGVYTTLGAMFRDCASVWMSVQVAADAEMTPRTRIVGAAYALNALNLNGYASTNYVRVPGAGSSGQALISAGAWPATWGTLGPGGGGTGTATTFTAGSVVFAGAGGVYSQNNANFFWDNTNLRLGIGTTSPYEKIDVVGRINANSDGSNEDPVGFGAISASSGPVGGSWGTSGTMSALCWSDGNYCFHGWSGPGTTAGGLLINLDGTGDAIQVTDGGITSFAVRDGGNVNLALGALQTAGTTRMTNAGVMQNTTWNGTAISTQYGGTGQNWSATAAGNVPYFTAGGTLGLSGAPAAAGYYLRSTSGTAMGWSTLQAGDLPAHNHWGQTWAGSTMGLTLNSSTDTANVFVSTHPTGSSNCAAVSGESSTRNIGRLGGENSTGDPIATSYNYGVYGYCEAAGWGGFGGVFRNSGGNYALLAGDAGIGRNYAGYFSGDTAVTGNEWMLTNGSGVYFAGSTQGTDAARLYASGNRLLVRAEDTDNVAQFASYGLYLPLDPGICFYAGGDIQVGYAGAADDDYVYMDNANQWLRWTESTGRFQFSSGLQLGGNLLLDTGQGPFSVAADIAFSRDDIAGWTTLYGSGVDDAYAAVALPFTFQAYGVDYPTVWICTNGWLSFGDPGAPWLGNGPLPNGTFAQTTFFPYWDDMVATGNGVRYTTVGVAPNRTFIVDYELVTYSSAYPVTFQVQIHEGSNLVNFRYYLANFNASGQGATIGMQGPGGGAAKALPVSCDGRVLDDNFVPMSISFSPIR